MPDDTPCAHNAVLVDKGDRLRGVCAGCGLSMWRPNGISVWEPAPALLPRTPDQIADQAVQDVVNIISRFYFGPYHAADIGRIIRAAVQEAAGGRR